MLRFLTIVVLCAAAQAATVTANITVNATLPLTCLTSASCAATGTATLTGGITDSGPFNATVATGTTGNLSGPYTFSLKNGNMGGTISVPLTSLISGQAASGTMTISSATGTYAGDSAPQFTITGTGSLGAAGATVSFTASNVTITTGGTVTAPPPTISAVQDAGSYTATIAPGSIFVVKGTNMSDNGLNSLAFPLPTTAGTGKTTITFTPLPTGSAIQAYLIYTYLQNGVNQLAAVLPSSAVAGNYNVVVGYNGVNSAPFPVAVATTKFGIITQDSTGSGLAAAQVVPSYALVRLTTGQVAGYQYGIQPAHPGDSVVIYGTGMGAVPGGDNVASGGYDFTQHNVTVQVILGGTTINAVYGGRTPGAAGLDQVVFAIPSSFSATGCAVPIQVKIGTLTSLATTLSVADTSSATFCTYPGLSQSQLQLLDQGGVYATGGFTVEQIAETLPTLGNVKEALASGSFQEVSGFELGAISSSGSGSFTSTTVGSCTIYHTTSGTSTVVTAGGSITYLDAGTVSLTSPSGTTNLTETSNTYSLNLGTSGIPGGNYTITGAGGKDVGKFTATIALGTPLTVTLPTTVTESAGLTLNWTGGGASDFVEIVGGNSTTTGTGTNQVTMTTGFVCTTTAGPGTFTIQPAVLTQIPTGGSNGFLDILSTPTPASFTASLTAGGSVTGTFTGLSGSGAQVTFQ